MIAVPMRSPRAWICVAFTAWGAVLLGVAVHAYFNPQAHSVFDIYRDASRNWWAGKDIYEPGRDLYRYSPFFAVGVSPFALLPDNWGNALWKIFNTLILAIGLARWAGRALPARLGLSEVAILFLASLPLAMHSLYIGQANLLMVGAALLGMSALIDEQWNRAAGWLALATMIKGYPLALALLATALYPRRLALRYVAALGLMLAAPFATQLPGVVAAQYVSWFGHLRVSTHIMRERLRSLDNLFELNGHPLAPGRYALLEIAAGLAVLGICLYLARKRVWQQVLLLRTYEWFAVWVVLFGPATEACTFVVIAPAIAWELLIAFRRPAHVATRMLLCISLLALEPLGTDLFPAVVRNFAIDHGMPALGALLFMSYLLRVTWRDVATNGRRAAAKIGAAPYQEDSPEATAA